MTRPSVLLLWIFVNLMMVSVFASEIKIETVKVPGGSLEPFWLGAAAKKLNTKQKNEIKKIPIAKFEVMTTQVTVKAFRKFLEEQPEWKKENVSTLFSDKSYLKNINDETTEAETPVTWVSWYAARAFCTHLGMSLPTINEWEYMAQASETKKSANKDFLFLKRILDWYGEPQEGSLKQVKSIYKNIYGIWDLHGLVWEWVEDFNSNFVTGESREDTSLNKDMFCGAGGMNSADQENYAAFMRFAFRSSLKGKSSVWNLGFRCVRR